MKRNMMRIVAVIFALMLTMGMSSAVFGATTLTSGIDNTGGNTVTIQKDLMMVNAESTTVREPNITYTYTLSEGTAGATITDSDGYSGTVKAGPVAANTNTNHAATATYTDTATASASATGTADSKDVAFTFNPSGFGGPGIYRYKITETQSPTKASVGVTPGSAYKDIRYLDVYVKKSSAGSGNEIYGYVLYEGAADQNQISGNEVGKTNGFVNAANDVDVYETENITINKTTTGAMADPDQTFSLGIALTQPSGVTAPKINVTTSGGGSVTGVTEDSTNGNYITLGTLTGSVKNGSSIKLTGIPKNTAVVLSEKNDSPDSYNVKMVSTNGSTDTNIYGGDNGTIVNAGATAESSSVTIDNTVTVAITNTLDEISPTNVVMRFAPFLFIFGAAILLLVMMRRRKAHNEE